MESEDSFSSIRECLLLLLHKVSDIGTEISKKSKILLHEMVNINHGDTSGLEKVGLGMIQAFETLDINVADITNPLQDTLQKVDQNRTENFEDLKLKVLEFKKTLATTDTTKKCLNTDTQTEDSYSTPEVEPGIRSQENDNNCESVKEINLGLRRTDTEDTDERLVDGLNKSPTAVEEERWNKSFPVKKVNVKEQTAQADEVASMKVRLEYRENRTERENSLSSSRMESPTQELNQRTEEQIKSFTELNNNLVARNEEVDSEMSEVQQLLKTTTEQYRELERKHEESELAHEEIIAKKNACIDMLKKELETANEILENCKTHQLHRVVEGLPSRASKLITSGPSYSEVYSKYVNVSEQYANKEEECARLSNYISCIVKEVQGKGLLIKTLRNALDAYESLKEVHDVLLNKVQQLRQDNTECKRLAGVALRENERLQKEVADLSRQVCHLLHKVERCGIRGSSSTSTNSDLGESICAADIITKKLVTFGDISELQATNKKLLVLVRELTERQEEVESVDPAAISVLKMKWDDLRESQNELLRERDCRNKMMVSLRSQRDIYENLYWQAVKASGEEVPLRPKRTFMQESGEKQENEPYRKENAANQKIRLERLNILSSHSEKFEVMQDNMEVCKSIGETEQDIPRARIKHQLTATYLNDETLQCLKELSKAELMLENLLKENALLKDAEQRLVKERELIKATLERTDAEARVKLDSRQDEAHRECSALRVQAEKLGEELVEARRDLIMKTARIDELKTALFTVGDTNADTHQKRDLKQQLSDVQEIMNVSFKGKSRAVENKYAGEVTRHSVDLQAFKCMKEDLDRSLGITSHSTNTQTQSSPIQPQRSARMRLMSVQPRTVAGLPSSQSSSAVTVAPQQKVHTPRSSTTEELFSSRTRLPTNYPRQVDVPPIQSSQDTEVGDSNMQVRVSTQTPVVAIALPPINGPTQERSSSSNMVATTQAGLKRQRDPTHSCQAAGQGKRTRVLPVASEGEKTLAPEDGEEEGREAGAAPSTNSRAKWTIPRARGYSN